MTEGRRENDPSSKSKSPITCDSLSRSSIRSSLTLDTAARKCRGRQTRGAHPTMGRCASQGRRTSRASVRRSDVQGGAVDELLAAAVNRALLDQLQVEIAWPPEDGVAF